MNGRIQVQGNIKSRIIAVSRLMSETTKTPIVPRNILFPFILLATCFAMWGLPGAVIARKFGYKKGVLVGLGIYILGGLLFYPASLMLQFSPFLIAFFVLAGGLSILETNANPYIIAMGPEETATRRLNLAQSFNPVGSLIGLFLCKFAILTKLEVVNEKITESMPAEHAS